MMEIGFSSLHQKGLLESYSLKKVGLLGMGKGIPLKKDRNRWGRGALIVWVIVKEKIVKSF